MEGENPGLGSKPEERGGKRERERDRTCPTVTSEAFVFQGMWAPLVYLRAMTQVTVGGHSL